MLSGVRINFEPELRCDRHLLPEGSKGFAHQFFVCVRAIYLCRIEERDAALHSGVEKRGHLLLVFRRAVRKAHSHAAEPDGGHFQIAFPEFALLHCFSFELSPVAFVPRARTLRMSMPAGEAAKLPPASR